MSYEGRMLEELKMPSREEVEKALLAALFKHKGVIKEFGSGEEIVDEISEDFVFRNNSEQPIYKRFIRRKTELKNLHFGIAYFLEQQIVWLKKN